MTVTESQSPFDVVFDVAIVGSGYAGYAAAITLRRQGRRVLMIAPHGDLLWESGRGFHPDAGSCADAAWQALVDDVARRGGATTGWLDGAIAEVAGTCRLVASGTDVLYYCRPVAARRDGATITSVVLATRAGTRRVAARQWIDATETGELVRLSGSEHRAQPPARTEVNLLLQHPDWSRAPAAPALRPTAWPTERVLSLQVTGIPEWRDQLLRGLEQLEDTLGDELANVSMSHVSVVPVSSYRGTGSARAIGADNVVAAVPARSARAVASLADRFMLGVAATHALETCEVAVVAADELRLPAGPPPVDRTLETVVCVAGAGTGGALAALAAASAGAGVLCLDSAPFAGGTGTGGGIHGYWFGVGGGLQDQVDQATRALMRRFRGGPLGDGPFNPWAKMIALERLLRESRVELHLDALLFDVVRDGDEVSAALFATPDGVVSVSAGAFIDGTGDGDLCALAGAEFTQGREHDGTANPYAQSAGRLRDLQGRPRMAIVNSNAGFCDPADPQDLTRARLAGVRQYLEPGYDNLSRPTYIAPALGVRQGRQIVTDYVLTLDDEISGRRFDDTIGYLAAHYDNRTADFEFESDEAIFWAWANRQYLAPVACEMTYRMLIPRGLANVWIASRCLGVSQDAHHAGRMQRDVQRAGEAAGFAAAEAIRHRVTAARLPYEHLRDRLRQTGALGRRPRLLNGGFGRYDIDGRPIDPVESPASDRDSTAERALAALDRGEPGRPIWWLYQHEDLVHDAVVERIAAHHERPMSSWLAACVTAMWRDPAAEPRMIQAIEQLEYGFGGEYPAAPGHDLRDNERLNPLEWNKVVPNWLCALALLRRCGTAACVPAIGGLLDRPVHGYDTLATTAITLDALGRHGLARPGPTRAVAVRCLDRLLDVQPLGTGADVERFVGRLGEQALHEMAGPAPWTSADAPGAEDWQLLLVVARARATYGLPPPAGVARFAHDARSFVRLAFAGLTQPSPAGSSPLSPATARVTRAR